MVRLLSFVIAAFIFSCTIIEDGDITSKEELDNLQFTSVEIKQETSSGTSTLQARVTSEHEVNISVAGGKLTRTVYMDWPALPATSKLKLKGGTTTAVRSYASFLESGKPWTFDFFSNGSDSTILELYSFRYSTNGRLSNIISRVPYVAGGPATSNDTLIYDGNGRLSSITRRFPGTGTSIIISPLQYRSRENSYELQKFTFQSLIYELACQGDGCNSPWWGGNYSVSPTSTSLPQGVMNVGMQQGEYVSLQDLNNIPNSCNGPCNAWIDTFYLHPLMILKDELPDGDDLLFLYMVDWWRPSPASPQASTTNEKVTFTFDYDF